MRSLQNLLRPPTPCCFLFFGLPTYFNWYLKFIQWHEVACTPCPCIWTLPLQTSPTKTTFSCTPESSQPCSFTTSDQCYSPKPFLQTQEHPTNGSRYFPVSCRHQSPHRRTKRGACTSKTASVCNWLPVLSLWTIASWGEFSTWPHQPKSQTSQDNGSCIWFCCWLIRRIRQRDSDKQNLAGCRGTQNSSLAHIC